MPAIGILWLRCCQETKNCIHDNQTVKEKIMTKITWLGHSAFSIEEDGVCVVIDPFLEGNPMASVSADELSSVDIVLVTHDHADHVGQAVEICKEHKAMLGCVVETAFRLMDEGVPQEQVLNSIGFNMGGTVSHKGVEVTMIPAFHTSGSGLPAGFIVRMPSGKAIYHAGDTSIFGDMALWGTLYPMDVALLPIGGVFTMDARQAAHAARLLDTKSVIPMHYATFPALDSNSKAFEEHLKELAPLCICHAIAPGETIEI